MRLPVGAPFRKTLISASQNARVGRWKIAGRQVTPQAPGWSIEFRKLHGGKQEGVDIIVLKNGSLTVTLVPTRGMSALSAEFDCLRLGWDSPVKQVIHPRHIRLHERGGLGWLEGFNEWIVRCGLENIGPPGPDLFQDHTGRETTANLTLHGRIANIPASEVEVIVDRRPPFHIRVRGRVDERMFGGPNLELWTEISTKPGSNELRIVDTITNRSGYEQEFQILYHANFGPPLLENGATFLAPVARVTPRDGHSARGLAGYARYDSPKPGSTERAYFLQPLADAQGRTLIALRNQARDRAVSMAFSLAELPFLTLWKSNAAAEDGYVTGLEPGTSFPNHRHFERQHGRVPRLPPGASCHAAIDIALHTTTEAVSRLAGRIALIQGRRKPVLARRPLIAPLPATQRS